jgi:hypothetical protein
MNIMKIWTSALTLLMAFGAQADVLKLDCKTSIPESERYTRSGKLKDPYMSSGYMVDYHAAHGPDGKPALVIGLTGSLGNLGSLRGANVVATLNMTKSYVDGNEITIPEDPKDAAIKVTDFVSVEGPKIIAGEKRECPDAKGKRCPTASYGYRLDLEKMTLIPEDNILYTYNCVENRARPELSHDEIVHDHDHDHE